MSSLRNDSRRKAAGIKCPSCRAPLQSGARFCGVCGHRLDDGKQTVQVGSGPTASSGLGALQNGLDDPYIGAVLNNRFVIESKIGEGGFGAVYRGKQKGTGRNVALKLLHPDMTQDENLTERFRREGLVLCNLRDAHTITTYDFDSTPDGTLYIAMELLEGHSLHDLYHREAPLEWRRMFRILGQMCSSLAEAHAHGIVHRDLKPENIYLENRSGNPEFVKILDFGIAKVMQGDVVGGQAAQLTATGQTLGTLEYMSPEQLMGKELDGRSDLYALGVLTYEMIIGRLPFPDAKGPAGLITAQLRQVPDPPSVANPAGSIPPHVDQIVLKMLEKEKTMRYAGVDVLRQHILELLGSGQWGAEVSSRMAAASGAELGPHDSHPDTARVTSYPSHASSPDLSLGPGGVAGPPPMHDPRMGQHPEQQSNLYGSSPGLQLPGPGQAGPGQGYAAEQQNPALHASHPGMNAVGQGHNLAMQPSPTNSDSRLWLWVAIVLILVGGAVGAALALA